MNKVELKVGNKVKIGGMLRSDILGGLFMHDIIDCVGEIICINTDIETPYLVEFDEPIKCGHDGGSVEGYSHYGKDGCCLWFPEAYLEPVKKKGRPKKESRTDVKETPVDPFKFKVGDRVKFEGFDTRYECDARVFNEVGTVKYVDEKVSNPKLFRPYLIEFDNDIDGHAGNMCFVDADGLCKDGHGWWCNECDLKLITEEPVVKETPKHVSDIILNLTMSDEFVASMLTLSKSTDPDCIKTFVTGAIFGNGDMQDLYKSGVVKDISVEVK